MFYTVTPVLQDQQASRFIEQVYLLGSDIEEVDAGFEARVAAELLTQLDLSGLTGVGQGDVRFLLVGDFDSPVFAKQFEDAQVYSKLWASWLPDST